MRRPLIMLMMSALAVLTACGRPFQVMDRDGMVRNSYQRITQEEAARMMEEEDSYIILDVRTREEFESGHIPGAVCLPNEDIDLDRPEDLTEVLPDRGQIILVYCRSGNRSRQASQKLADSGYTSVYEFGGINDWTGEVVTGP